MNNLNIYLLSIITVLFSSCNSNPVSKSQEVSDFPQIFPDYNEIVIPRNIAPLNFSINENGENYFVEIKSLNGKSILINSGSSSIDIPIRAWRKLLKNNIGNDIKIDVYVKDSSKNWNKYKPLRMSVSEYAIDSHLAYRLINVGYILWRKMGLYQRDLTSFKETAIMLNRNTDANCMNCHSFSQNNPQKTIFHLRGMHAGTILIDDGEIKKINTKTPYTMSAAVYPSWHPGGKHIAYSVNIINQWFHGVGKGNEVYDKASDIVVYDIEKNMITTSPKISSKNRETLPCWSPDGKFIYYTSADQYNDSAAWESVHYNLLRIAYNVESNTWGKVDTILLATDIDKSITFPKVSPDGKYILFTAAGHGYFTIYDNSSDLYIFNTETKECSEYPFNSEEVDSYHSWSSNGRWIVFSSKRIDGLCTRPWFSYIDETGKASKPFVMPQKDPMFYYSFKNNFNVPELVNGAVKVNKPELLKVARSKSIDAEFDKSVNIDGLSGATKIDQDKLH